MGERFEYIATGRALSLVGELLPPYHGSQQHWWRWRWSRWRWLRGQFPVPAGCRNRDFCPPKLVFDGGGAAKFSWMDTSWFRVFASEVIYRRKGDVRGTWGAHTTWWRGHKGACHPMVWLPRCPPPSLLWTSCTWHQNRDFGLYFVQFQEYFMDNFSKIQK
jgi:hypothetical protein